MKYLDLKKAIPGNIFTLLDVVKFFPQEKSATTRNQLSRFMKAGQIFQIKRGLYCFDQSLINDLQLANILVPNSYISLESALNYYGMIPDIPLSITSITPTKTKKIKGRWGSFLYFRLKKELFFGYQTIKGQNSQTNYNIAQKEKALLDYFYLRKINNLRGLRLQLNNLDKKIYRQYAQSFPQWVKKIDLNE